MHLRTFAAVGAGVALAGTAFLVADRAGVLGLDASASFDGPASAYGDAVGELVPDLAFDPLDGRASTLSRLLDGHRALVVVMRDASCPVAKKYGPRVAAMEERYAGQDVAFLYLNVNRDDVEEVVRREELDGFGFAGPYVLDPDGGEDRGLARGLRPRTTTEVFVIDGSRTLRYRGAVDDQYGIDFTKREVGESWLADAVDAVLAGGEVPVPETFPSGCILPEIAHTPATPAASAASLPPTSGRPVTWHSRVSRIVQENCVGCHRDGGVAPFSLESYDRAYAFRAMVRFMVEDGRMPPWFARGGTGEWANERGLTEREKADLFAWIDAGAPEGDPDDAPLPRSFAPGWNVGEPDAVVRLEEAVEIPAEGFMDYEYLYVKTDFPEDRWIERMEIRPTAPEVTHHVLVFIEPPGAKPASEAAPGEPVFQGGIARYFAAYVPGSQGSVYGDGMAKKLPAGAWLKFQLHYTPNGRPTTDRTELGLVFADGPPEHEVETRSAFNTRFRIPAGAPDHSAVAEYTFPADGRLLSLFPHLHVRGKAFRFELLHPDGREELLLDVPRYDFNWQIFYRFREPRWVAEGTVLRATGWWDNSSENPFNPDPTAEVGFGEQTYDEMLIGYFDWVRDPVGPGDAAGTAGRITDGRDGS